MKKIILSLSIMLSLAALADGIGYVDYDVMYKNIPISKQLQTQIDAKVQEVRAYNKQTSVLSKAQTTKEAKAQVISQRKEGLYKIEKEYIDLRYKQQDIVRAKVKAAATIVRAQKNLDIIIDKKSAIVGGVDCTQEVLKAVK